MAPPVVNRLASAATAAPFVPETKKPEKAGLDFSCIVEPPPKRGRTNPPMPADAPESDRRGASTAPIANVAAPSLGGKQSQPPMAADAGAVAKPAPVAATTVPPFATGGTTAPFAPAGSQAPFEFTPPEAPKVRWFGWGSALLVAGCVAGYFQYQRMERERIEASRVDVTVAAAEAARVKIGEDPGPAGAPPPGVALDANGRPIDPQAVPAAGVAAKVGESASEAKKFGATPTPFTALKQAKAMIKDADDKRKAAYGTVEAMLDDPTGSAPLPGEANPPAKKTAAPAIVSVGPVQTGLPAGARLVDVKGDLIVIDGTKPTPNAAFIQWARTVKIGGVRPGAAARVLIGNASFGLEDEIDAQRGIVFVGYDESSRLVRFRDATGAELSLRR